MAADEKVVPKQPENAIRIVDPSILSKRNAMVALRMARHPSDEEYERILARLEEQKLRRNAIFVTSVEAGDGTTTTAANLAGALRRRDTSVLLVELRLTEPSLLGMMGNPPGVTGLEEALLGKAPFEDCVFHLGKGTLQVLAVKAALSVEEAAQQSGGLNDLLVWAEDHFDSVVVDCPPVTSSSWTRWFTLNADPVLLVAKAGGTRMRDLKKVADLLKDHLAGVLLNESQQG
jgi:Mrp family chromosome partitioning ATPase